LCPGHKKVADFVQKHFVSATNVSQFAQPKKHHEQQCVRNNVFSFARALSRSFTRRSSKVLLRIAFGLLLPVDEIVLTKSDFEHLVTSYHVGLCLSVKENQPVFPRAFSLASLSSYTDAMKKKKEKKHSMHRHKPTY